MSRLSTKFLVSFSESTRLHERPDASLLLRKPTKSGFDVEVIPFKSRLALEEFNKKAGLRPVIYTQVQVNCVIWKHQSDSEARKAIS